MSDYAVFRNGKFVFDTLQNLSLYELEQVVISMLGEYPVPEELIREVERRWSEYEQNRQTKD